MKKKIKWVNYITMPFSAQKQELCGLQDIAGICLHSQWLSLGQVAFNSPKFNKDIILMIWQKLNRQIKTPGHLLICHFAQEVAVRSITKSVVVRENEEEEDEAEYGEEDLFNQQVIRCRPDV